MAYFMLTCKLVIHSNCDFVGYSISLIACVLVLSLTQGQDPMATSLWLMTVYEVYKYYMCYCPPKQQELILCQVNNQAYAHVILTLAWVVCGERTLTSFLCYVAIAITGVVELSLKS